MKKLFIVFASIAIFSMQATTVSIKNETPAKLKLDLNNTSVELSPAEIKSVELDIPNKMFGCFVPYTLYANLSEGQPLNKFYTRFPKVKELIGNVSGMKEVSKGNLSCNSPFAGFGAKKNKTVNITTELNESQQLVWKVFMHDSI